MHSPDRPAATTCGNCHEGWLIDQPGPAKECPCRRERIAVRHMIDAGVPPRYAAMTLESFDRSASPSASEGYAAVLRMLDEPPGTGRGILFMGPPGTGKSHLAIALFRNFIARGATGAFITWPALCRELQATFKTGSKVSESDILEHYINLDVLALDELGARRASDWTMDTLFDLLASRYENLRVSILTSNFSGQELGERIGGRLASRLAESCTRIQLSGPDYRLRGAR